MAGSLKDMGLAITSVASKMGHKEKDGDDAIGELVGITLKKYKDCRRKKNLIKNILNELLNYSDSE